MFPPSWDHPDWRIKRGMYKKMPERPCKLAWMMMDFPARHVWLLKGGSSLIFISSKFYHEGDATQPNMLQCSTSYFTTSNFIPDSWVVRTKIVRWPGEDIREHVSWQVGQHFFRHHIFHLKSSGNVDHISIKPIKHRNGSTSEVDPSYHSHNGYSHNRFAVSKFWEKTWKLDTSYHTPGYYIHNLLLACASVGLRERDWLAA